jgi:hypothetical protein
VNGKLALVVKEIWARPCRNNSISKFIFTGIIGIHEGVRNGKRKSLSQGSLRTQQIVMGVIGVLVILAMVLVMIAR